MARLLRATTVVRDGFHNAFTDLLHWQGAYWVSYRKGTGHISTDADAILAVSSDRQRFREVGRLRIAGDVRDPKMVADSEDRLAIISPSWIGGHERRNLQTYVTFTNNGADFEKPIPILSRNEWLWRVVKHGGRYYGACYDFPIVKDERPHRTTLMVSDNLVTWERISRIGDDSISIGESGMHFRTDGELWVVSRQSRGPAMLSIAKPPYTQWETIDTRTRIHSPIILEHKGSLYVSGRRNADVEGDATYPYLSRSGLGIWKLERAGLTPVMRLPAAGDCAYPGFIVDPAGRVCISWYTQHAYVDGTIERPYRMDTEPKYDKGTVLPLADVYFAELELD
jgi:hypothetical protein